jgi:hypothetical protein
MASWGFTTSRYDLFTDLVTRDREIAAPRAVAQDSVAADFETFAREAGVETVAYSDRLMVTPLLRLDRSACVALLFESPEPLEADARLSIEIEGAPTSLIPNVDGTRVFALPAGGGTLPSAVLDVTLRFLRNAGAALPVFAVSGNSADEFVTFQVEAGGES